MVFLQIALLIGIVSLPSAALATDMVYKVYGEFDSTVSAFTQAALIFSDDNYMTLFVVFGSLGLMFGGAVALFRGASTGKVNFTGVYVSALAGLVFFAAFVIPKGTLTIEDQSEVRTVSSAANTTTGTNQVQAVGDLPEGIVIIMGLTNLLTNGFIDMIATSGAIGSDPANVKRNPNGFGLNLLSKINTDFSAPEVSQSQKAFIKDCVVYEIYRPGSTISAKDLLATDDLLTLLDNAATPTVFTTNYTSTPQGVGATCAETWTAIKNAGAQPATTNAALRETCAATGIDVNDADALNTCIQYVSDSAVKMGLATSAASLIFKKQLAEDLATTLQTNDAGENVTFTTMLDSNQKGFGVGYSMFHYLPLSKQWLRTIIIMSIPFLFLFVATPMVGRVLGGFFFLTLWMSLWDVLGAVATQYATTYMFGQVAGRSLSEIAGLLNYTGAVQEQMSMLGYVIGMVMTLSSLIAGFVVKGVSAASVAGGASAVSAAGSNSSVTQGDVERRRSQAVSSAVGISNAGAYNTQEQITAGTHDANVKTGTGLGTQKAVGAGAMIDSGVKGNVQNATAAGDVIAAEKANNPSLSHGGAVKAAGERQGHIQASIGALHTDLTSQERGAALYNKMSGNPTGAPTDGKQEAAALGMAKSEKGLTAEQSTNLTTTDKFAGSSLTGYQLTPDGKDIQGVQMKKSGMSTADAIKMAGGENTTAGAGIAQWAKNHPEDRSGWNMTANVGTDGKGSVSFSNGAGATYTDKFNTDKVQEQDPGVKLGNNKDSYKAGESESRGTTLGVQKASAIQKQAAKQYSEATKAAWSKGIGLNESASTFVDRQSQNAKTKQEQAMWSNVKSLAQKISESSGNKKSMEQATQEATKYYAGRDVTGSLSFGANIPGTEIGGKAAVSQKAGKETSTNQSTSGKSTAEIAKSMGIERNTATQMAVSNAVMSSAAESQSRGERTQGSISRDLKSTLEKANSLAKTYNEAASTVDTATEMKQLNAQASAIRGRDYTPQFEKLLTEQYGGGASGAAKADAALASRNMGNIKPEDQAKYDNALKGVMAQMRKDTGLEGVPAATSVASVNGGASAINEKAAAKTASMAAEVKDPTKVAQANDNAVTTAAAEKGVTFEGIGEKVNNGPGTVTAGDVAKLDAKNTKAEAQVTQATQPAINKKEADIKAGTADLERSGGSMLAQTGNLLATDFDTQLGRATEREQALPAQMPNGQVAAPVYDQYNTLPNPTGGMQASHTPAADFAPQPLPAHGPSRQVGGSTRNTPTARSIRSGTSKRPVAAAKPRPK